MAEKGGSVGNHMRAQNQHFGTRHGDGRAGKVRLWRRNGDHGLKVKYSGFPSRRGCARLAWFGLLAPGRPLFQGVVPAGESSTVGTRLAGFRRKNPRDWVCRERGPRPSQKLHGLKTATSHEKEELLCLGTQSGRQSSTRKRPPTRSAAAFSRV